MKLGACAAPFVGVAALLAAGAAAAGIPAKLQQQGRLLGADDKPLSAEVDLTVTFHRAGVDDELQDNRVWLHKFTGVQVHDGFYNVLVDLEAGTWLDRPYFESADTLWLGVEVGTDGEMSPRLRVASVPFALRAADAEELGGMAPAAYAKWADLPWSKNDMTNTFAKAVSTALAGSTVSGDLSLSGTGKLTAAEVKAPTLCIGADCRTSWLWSKSGNDLSYSGGNVGIGTASPAHRLHVSGATLFENTGGTGQAIIKGGTANPKQLVFRSDDNSDSLVYRSAGAPNVGVSISGIGDQVDIGPNVVLAKTSGNVGIGSAEPAFPLQVKRSSSATVAALTTSDHVIGTTGSRLDMGLGASTGDTYARIQAVSSGGTAANDLVLQESGGSVGIGTTSPGHTLDVNGRSNFRDAVTLPAGNFVQGSSHARIWAATGLSTGSMTYSGYGPTLSYLAKVDGGVWKGTGGGDASLLETSEGQLAYSTATGVTAGSTLSWNHLFTIEPGGDVGIGTTNPDATLHVKGTMKVLGSWTNGSVDTPTQAATDGFVVASISVDGGEKCVVAGYTDSDTTFEADKARGSASAQEVSGTSTRVITNSFMMPVRKGDYWQVTLSNDGSGANCINNAKVQFIPLGL